MALSNRDVGFTPESGHSPTRSGYLLWAKSRLMHRKQIYADWQLIRRAYGECEPLLSQKV